MVSSEAVRGRDHLHQGHHRGRIEEVDAAHLVGPARLHGHVHHGKGGGVGGQDGLVVTDPVELGEEVLLHGQVLDHRLDDQVAAGQGREIGYRRDPGHGRVHGPRCVTLPLSTCFPSDLAMPATIASAVPWARDRRMTSNPCTAAVSAMPEPMMPDPTIPMRLMDMAVCYQAVAMSLL